MVMANHLNIDQYLLATKIILPSTNTKGYKRKNMILNTRLWTKEKPGKLKFKDTKEEY